MSGQTPGMFPLMSCRKCGALSLDGRIDNRTDLNCGGCHMTLRQAVLCPADEEAQKALVECAATAHFATDDLYDGEWNDIRESETAELYREEARTILRAVGLLESAGGPS